MNSLTYFFIAAMILVCVPGLMLLGALFVSLKEWPRRIAFMAGHVLAAWMLEAAAGDFLPAWWLAAPVMILAGGLLTYGYLPLITGAAGPMNPKGSH